jgi:hypothetical protein
MQAVLESFYAFKDNLTTQQFAQQQPQQPQQYTDSQFQSMFRTLKLQLEAVLKHPSAIDFQEKVPQCTLDRFGYPLFIVVAHILYNSCQ